MILLIVLIDQRCRELVFNPEQSFNGKRLLNHVVNIVDVADEDSCGYLCFMEPNCASYNFEIPTSQAGVHKCELSNSTHEIHGDDLVNDQNFLYRGSRVSLYLKFDHTHYISILKLADRLFLALMHLLYSYHNCNKILKSDWLSAVLTSALIDHCPKIF